MIIKRYNCVFPTFTEDGESCVSCNGMLARGDFAQAVAELRYEDDPRRRYDGLSWLEAERLNAALVELADLSGTWVGRAACAEDHAEDVTLVDQGLYYDYGRVPARWYNEDGGA